MADTTAPAGSSHAASPARRGPEPPDVFEKGGMKDGQPQRLNQRLFMQFLAFGGAPDSAALVRALEDANVPGVLYEDVNDPQGVGLLTFAEQPEALLTELRPFLQRSAFGGLAPKPEYTMLGRTYAIGYEPEPT